MSLFSEKLSKQIGINTNLGGGPKFFGILQKWTLPAPGWYYKSVPTLVQDTIQSEMYACIYEKQARKVRLGFPHLDGAVRR